MEGRLNRWLRERTGATMEIRKLRSDLAEARMEIRRERLRYMIEHKRHLQDTKKLQDTIQSLKTQDPLARFLDTQRNHAQKQAIRELQKHVLRLGGKLD